MAEVDPDQEAALRRLRAAFGFVQVLRIVDHNDGQDQGEDEPIDGGDEPPPADRSVSAPALRRYTTRWRWFG
jgi:hypothetical protein